jgi:hypothetical protein
VFLARCAVVDLADMGFGLGLRPHIECRGTHFQLICKKTEECRARLMQALLAYHYRNSIAHCHVGSGRATAFIS